MIVFQVTHFWFVGTITLIEIVRSLPGAFFIDFGWWVTRCTALWQSVLGYCACSRFNRSRCGGLKFIFRVTKNQRNFAYFEWLLYDSGNFKSIPNDSKSYRVLTVDVVVVEVVVVVVTV